MSETGQFQSGPDPRRHRGGRPPGAVGLSALVRRKLTPFAPEILDRMIADAKSGDPEAIGAFCALLGAVANRQPDGQP